MTVLGWLMLGAIVFGLGGYGVTNFGGGVSSIGTVGDQDITTRDYGQALQHELDALRAQMGSSLTAEQAVQLGLDTQVQQRLVTTAALDSENDALGVSVGNVALRQQIAQMQAFHGPDGKFDKQTYAFVLQQNGMTEADFEAKMRLQMAREILQQAVAGAVPASQTYVDAVVAFAGERRGFTILKIGAANLTAPVAAPTDAELHAYYDAHKDAFTQPEAKVISYAALTPDMMADKITIDDKTLQELYDKNKASYETPEKRLVERLVFPDEAAAKAAKDALDAGQKTFEQLVADRGLKMTDIDMGDVTEDELSKEAGPAVFAVKDKGVVGPVMSSLGPAIFRVNGVIAAQTRSFDEVKAELAQGLKQDKAAQMISSQVEGINDKLAGGATLQDLAHETDMQLGQMDFTEGDTAGMAAYAAFREAAAKVKAGDYPQLIQLKDGGVAALQLDKVKPAELIPFDKVADKVKAAWTAEATAKALKARADEIAAAVKGGTDFASFGTLDPHDPITRGDFVDGVPKTLVPDVFKLAAAGDLTTLQEGDAAYVVRLDKIEAAKPDDPDVKKLREALTAQAAQGIENDSFAFFATDVLRSTKVTLDKGAIAAVNAQFH